MLGLSSSRLTLKPLAVRVTCTLSSLLRRELIDSSSPWALRVIWMTCPGLMWVSCLASLLLASKVCRVSAGRAALAKTLDKVSPLLTVIRTSR
ncbi:hypothetical protein D3C81_2152960 [compost metagenome]